MSCRMMDRDFALVLSNALALYVSGFRFYSAAESLEVD
jgi:hypothetical protein